MSIFRRLLGLIAPFRWWIALGVLLTFATIGANVGLMAMSAYLIAKAALVTLLLEIGVAVTFVRVFAISRAVLRYVERSVTHTATFRILTHLRVWFYRSIEPLAPAGLQLYRSGDLLTRIMSDIETLENFYVRVVVPPVAAALVTAVACLIVGLFSLWLAFILLLFLLLTGVVLPLASHRLSRELGAGLAATRSRLSATLVDEIQGIADLLAFGQAASYQSRVVALDAALHARQEKAARIRAAAAGLGALFSGLAGLSLLALAIPLVNGGQIDGVFLAVLPLTAVAAFEAVQPLALALQLLEESRAAGRRLFELIDAEPPVTTPPQPAGRPETMSLSFENVRFRYGPEEPWTLDGVTFHVPDGGRLAVVGPSGAGKSTLINLLLRFWDVDGGAIRVGGGDLTSYAPDDVRAWMAVVSQHPHLFNTTIRDNLLLANGEATDAEIEAACRRARLHEFILSLPDGYETRVGENGHRLSGGERQRLALARAFLKDAPILILDEATSHLDPVTAEQVLRALAHFMEGRTTLLIAHETAGLSLVDRVLVLENGRGRLASMDDLVAAAQ